MKIAIAIKIYTGSTSQKPIIEDRVKVVARPTRNSVARSEPKSVVILFTIRLTVNWRQTR